MTDQDKRVEELSEKYESWERLREDISEESGFILNIARDAIALARSLEALLKEAREALFDAGMTFKANGWRDRSISIGELVHKIDSAIQEKSK